jgi:hypothetical protein
MNCKPTLFAVYLFLLSPPLRAQYSIGLEGGFSLNSLNTNVSNRVSTRLVSDWGFNLSLPLRYALTPWLYIKAAPTLLKKDYSLDRTDSLYGAYQRFNNTYFQLPIGISLAYGKKLLLLADPGIYMGYWTGGRTKGKTPDIFNIRDTTDALGQNLQSFQLSSYNNRYQFSSQRDNRWEWGWTLGLEAQYPLHYSWRLTASADYFQSLSSQQKPATNPIPAYNQTWTFSLGLTWMHPPKKPSREK